MKKLIIKLVSIWAKRVTRRSDKLFQRHKAACGAAENLKQKLLQAQAQNWDRAGAVYVKAYTAARTSSARAHRRWSAAWNRKKAWQARESVLRLLWGIDE